jgi:serine/threonine-protein kinase
MVQVPSLGYAQTAEADLAAAGLKLGRQDETSSDTVPAGVVTEQDPAEGTQVQEGTAVDIVVSTGPQQAPIGVSTGSQQAPIGNSQQAEKGREKQQQEAEKEREKQQQEAEKEQEKQQQEAEKEKEKKQQEEEKGKEKGD